MTKSYNIEYSERLLIIMNWLGGKGLQFVQTITEEEKEKCNSSTGLFDSLNKKLRSMHNETILSLQYCKLSR